MGLLRWLISLTFLLESVRVDSVHSRTSTFLGISEIKLLSSVGTYSTDDLLKDQLRFQPQKQTYFPSLISFLYFFFFLIYSFMAVLGLSCFSPAPPGWGERELLWL